MEKLIRASIKISVIVLLTVVLNFHVLGQTESTAKTFPPEDYEYYIGNKVYYALSKGCSMLLGKITDIENSEITISIEEKYSKNKLPNIIKVKYKSPNLAIAFRKLHQSPWRLVDVKLGNKLILSNCNSPNNNQRSRNLFVSSDTKLFPSIKKATLHYMKFKENPAIILDSLDQINSIKDKVFFGYLSSFISRGGAIRYPDFTVLSLSELLKNKNVPDSAMSMLRMQLSGLITENFVFPITDETRKKSLITLFTLGSSESQRAKQAVIILTKIPNTERVDLSIYSNQFNKMNLIKNLHSVPSNLLSNAEKNKFLLVLAGQ